MAKTGVVKKPFPYAADGVNIEQLQEGRVFSFPDRIFSGLEKDGYVEASEGEPENSAAEAAERDAATDDITGRLMGMSDQELKDIIARSGQPITGNLVHADMVARARAQIVREREGKAPVLGVDPNAGVTEQPLAKPGEATPNSAAAAVEQQQAQAENVREGEVKTAAQNVPDARAKPAAQRPQEYASTAGTEDATAGAGPHNQFGEPLPERSLKADSGELSDRTVAELKEIAAAEEVDLSGAARKDDIIAAISKHRKAQKR